MSKRKDRLSALEHERTALESLKTAEHNATPTEHQALSEALLDLAIAAITEVYRLEEGEAPKLQRLDAIYKQALTLPEYTES